MPENSGFTVERLARELARAFEPLATRLTGGQTRELFLELGLDFPPSFSALPAFATALGTTVTAVQALPPLISSLSAAIAAEDAAQIASVGANLVGRVAQVISAFDGLSTSLGAVAGSVPGMNPADVTAFAATLAERLLEYSVVTYLEGHHEILLQALQLFGVMEIRDVAPDPLNPRKIVHQRKRVRLERLGTLFSDPKQLFSDLYGWGTPAFTGQELLKRLRELLHAFTLPAYLEPNLTPNSPASLHVLPFSLLSRIDPPGLPGLEMRLVAELDPAPLRVPFVEPGWFFELDVDVRGDAGVGILLRPREDVRFTAGGQLDAEVFFRFVREPVAPAQSVILFGQEGGSRLQTQRLSFGAGGAVRWNTGTSSANGEAEFGAKIEGGKLVISAGSLDGFLAKILPPDGFEVGFDFGILYGTRAGLRFEGSAGIATTLPLHWQLGPATIESLHVELGINPQGLALELSINGGGKLGPISASVERLGVKGLFAFREGNLGPLDLSIGFKFPTGLGIAIDAGPITGGGFISFDPDNGRYAGILELKLWSIQVTAIGLLDTKVQGAPFSFLLVIAVELPPIQLGFGFTLNGLGGLVGIHRTVKTDVLLDRVKHGAVDHIMFPEDPVRNATQIISDLREIFPPAADRYVFGPMAILGWGTPTLIRAEIGLILEVPAPIRIVLLGTLSIDLPAPEAPVVVIRIDVLGVLDFAEKFLAIDAILRDSNIAGMPLGGGMSLRLHWGDEPSFLFSVGGLHPAFQAPPGFPDVPRLSLAVDFGPARLTLQAYLAISSNSFQLGARVELFAGSSSTYIRGWAGFDVLFIFVPFSFRADISAGVELVVGGARLASLRVSATLTGPNPYHAWGEACLSLLFFDICVGFDATFGGGTADPPLPPVPVWPLLEGALKDLGNWSSELQGSVTNVVSLRAPGPAAPQLLVHPMGSLTVRQKIVPLDREITKFGEQSPADAHRFTPTAVAIGDGAGSFVFVSELFAPGQFQALSDSEKLSRPSFEKMPAGVTVRSSNLEHGPTVVAKLTYETKIVDSPWDTREAPKFTLERHRMLAMSKTGAVARSGLRASGDKKYVADTPRKVARIADEAFVIATTRDLSVRADLTAPTTKGAALASLKAHLLAHPEARESLHVVSLADLEDVA